MEMTTQEADSQYPAQASHGFIRRFLVLYAAAALILTALMYGILKVETNLQQTNLQIHESGQVEIAAQLLAHDFEGVSSDLMLLAHSPSVTRYLANPTAGNKETVADLMATLAGEKQLYDKVRYIDLHGNEVIRVNLKNGIPEETPQSALQNKGQRYFFREAFQLSDGEVYVSPLDLNVDNGKIEIPYKPMVRFATPIFNSARQKVGILMLNLLGDKLIEHLHLAIMDDAHAMLLNSDGDWLSGPDPEQEWGFMFNRPPGFARQFPAEWRVIAANDWGSLKTASGLFTYTTVNPVQASQPPVSAGANSGPAGGRMESAGYFWKIVSRVPPEELPSVTLSNHPVLLAIYGGSLVFLMFLVGYIAFVFRSRMLLRQAIFDSERRLRELAQTLAEGVYVLDEQGLITYINPEAKRLLGWAPQDDLLGKNAHELFHYKRPDGAPLSESDCPVTKVIRSGQAYRNEEEVFWKKNGKLIPIRVSSSPIVREGKVTGSVVAFQDITARKRSQEAIHRLAYYDTLTNLPNRRLFMDRFSHALTQASRYHRALAVMFLDLDHFKEINDSLGHDVGDELLKAVAARLSTCVRSGDTVARQGGDEFVILLAEIRAVDDAIQVAEKLLSILQGPVQISGHTLQVSGSIGIAIYPEHGMADIQDLMKKADLAMYAAKRDGRNRYCLFG
ncbi:MAG: diguanylate cyclase [Betaproteobacteria bacterium]|nr:diguanylate cyclase [Betaproteobacteria bacterium]